MSKHKKKKKNFDCKISYILKKHIEIELILIYFFLFKRQIYLTQNRNCIFIYEQS